MSIVVTSTKELPEFSGAQYRVVAVKVVSGTISLEYRSGSSWVVAKTYSSDSVDAVLFSGAVRVVFNGVGSVEIGD